MNDAKLKQVVEDFRDGILSGRSSEFMCFAVCSSLHAYLEFEYDMVTNMVHGEVDCGEFTMDHVWLELSDGRILDPTIDQFPTPLGFGSLPKVYIGEEPSWFERHSNQADISLAMVS